MGQRRAEHVTRRTIESDDEDSVDDASTIALPSADFFHEGTSRAGAQYF